jgi:hypothetical protein
MSFCRPPTSPISTVTASILLHVVHAFYTQPLCSISSPPPSPSALPSHPPSPPPSPPGLPLFPLWFLCRWAYATCMVSKVVVTDTIAPW